MVAFPSLRSLARRFFGPPEQRSGDAYVGGWGAFVSPDAITPEVAIRVTSILACARFIAQGVAVCPVDVLREMPNGDCRPAIDIPGYSVLTKAPNAWQSPYEYRENVNYHCAMYGNAYSRIISTPKAWLSALVPWHPTRVRPMRANDGSIWYELTNWNGVKEVVPASEIVHYRWLSDNSFVGMVPSDLCATSLSLARSLDQAATSWWSNSARPDVVIETSETVGTDAANEFRRVWREVYGGPRARGGVAILPKKSTLRTIESNAAEASQFSQLRRDIALEIANVYGVPGSLVGIREVKSYNTTEQEHLSAQVWCLQPWQSRFEGAWNRSILSAYDGVSARFNLRERLRADTETRSKLYDVLAKWGAVSPNEIRWMEGLPRLDDPAADLTYIQSGFTTLENAADVSMTDGQLAQLVGILNAVSSGEMPAGAAEPLIVQVWPQLPPKIVARIIAAAAARAEEVEETFAPALPAPAPGDAEESAADPTAVGAGDGEESVAVGDVKGVE